MPAWTTASGEVRVTCPATHVVRSRRAGGSPEGDTGDDAAVCAALVGSLRSSGFTQLDEFELRPAAAPSSDSGAESAPCADSEPVPSSTKATTEPDELAVDVDVAAGHDAVVLAEQDGCYSWHLPVSSTSRLAARRAARTASFAIPLAPAGRSRDGARVPAPLPDDASAPLGDAPARRLLDPAVWGPARLFVLRFPAPPLAGQVMSFLERGVDRGFVRLTSADPAGWSRVDRLDEVLAPTGGPARVLLFVHGTFTNTVGTFGALALTPFGRAFLERALRAYDAVLGFDHPTLSVDPLANATDLLARLRIPRSVTVDVVCHSRGGLSTRSFVEQVLPASGWDARAGRVVFVGATNGGTNLANPQRWADLLDLLTNLTAASVRALALLPGVGSLAAVIDGSTRGLGVFVQYLAAYALSPGGVPGLAAMVPDGPFVTEINRTQPGQPPPGTPWYVVSSDFHVELEDDGQRPFELPMQVALRLAEEVVDEVFQGPNDLVVDVASMSAIDLAAGDYVAEELAFGTNETVHHLGYVLQERFVAALHTWLLDLLETPPENSRQ